MSFSYNYDRQALGWAIANRGFEPSDYEYRIVLAVGDQPDDLDASIPWIEVVDKTNDRSHRLPFGAFTLDNTDWWDEFITGVLVCITKLDFEASHEES